MLPHCDSADKRISKILIIEDDDFYFEALQQNFRRLGAHIFHAMSLTAALTALNEHVFELIVVDLGLPDFGAKKEDAASRLSVLRTVISASLSSIHLVITGRYSVEEAKKCKQIGAKGYFSKSQLNGPLLARLLDEMRFSEFVVHSGDSISTLVTDCIPTLTSGEEECIRWVEKRPSDMKKKDMFEYIADKFDLNGPHIVEQKYKRARKKVRAYEQNINSVETRGDRIDDLEP